MIQPLPTRLTAHNTAGAGRPVRIWWNGHELHHVVEADTAEGWAEILITDAFGHPRLDPITEQAATKVLRGKVEARLA